MRLERLMGYFKETRGCGEGAGRWFGEGVLAGWRVFGKAMHQRIATMRTIDDVQVNRATKLTEAEEGVLSKCSLCGQSAAGRRNEHLLFKCIDAIWSGGGKEGSGGCSRKEGGQTGEDWPSE